MKTKQKKQTTKGPTKFFIEEGQVWGEQEFTAYTKKELDEALEGDELNDGAIVYEVTVTKKYQVQTNTALKEIKKHDN